MRGRVLILIGLIVLGGAAVAALLLLGGGSESDGDPTVTPGGGGQGTPGPQVTPFPDNNGTNVEQPTPAPEGFGVVVIATQDLPRGFRITQEVIDTRLWPNESVPDFSFDNPGDVIGLIARTSIPLGSPILATQLIEDPRAMVGEYGSDVATLIEPGKVAVAVPADFTGLRSVAYGIQPGDTVDIVMHFLFIDVDEEFQTRKPNKLTIFGSDENGNPIVIGEFDGRVELDPNFDFTLEGPNTDDAQQRPRLITQRIVTGARVLWINWFPETGDIYGIIPTPTSPVEEDEPAPRPAGGTPGATLDIPTETPEPPYIPFIMTVEVLPQEALVIAWAVESQIPMSYFLRSVADPPGVGSATEPVTLRYIIQEYNLPQPEELRSPFAIEPPVTEIERFDLRSLPVFLYINAITEAESSTTTQPTPQTQNR